MDIDIKELRDAITEILDHISNELKVDKVPLDRDYYWDIPSECLYSMQNPPSELDVGCLADDLEFLKGILQNKEQAVSLMLTHAASLLRYIGEKVEQ